MALDNNNEPELCPTYFPLEEKLPDFPMLNFKYKHNTLTNVK